MLAEWVLAKKFFRDKDRKYIIKKENHKINKNCYKIELNNKECSCKRNRIVLNTTNSPLRLPLVKIQRKILINLDLSFVDKKKKKKKLKNNCLEDHK
ncbi:hypothetical protein BpHYR1_050092 [Brachionus plicatilis]|uniref:Uncharacterized protein n=1 Tax=Brachionus plicatilis TaxID=10195 RepID=A0A3M7QW78_BRAPC|nr:hypothetical protein BpHYR1_050092 [Brachionus plicatilis]